MVLVVASSSGTGPLPKRVPRITLLMADPSLDSTATGYTGPRRSLILAGGGMRVAYQAGVFKALGEFGLRFAHGDGTSGGTMNLAMMLSGLSPDDDVRTVADAGC